MTLEDEGWTRVVAAAAGVTEVLRAVAWHRPDVPVLGMRLRGAVWLGELIGASEPCQPWDRTVAITRATAATFSRLP